MRVILVRLQPVICLAIYLKVQRLNGFPHTMYREFFKTSVSHRMLVALKHFSLIVSGIYRASRPYRFLGAKPFVTEVIKAERVAQ